MKPVLNLCTCKSWLLKHIFLSRHPQFSFFQLILIFENMTLETSNQEILVDPLRQKFCDILKSNGVIDEVDEIIVTEPPELKGEHFACVTVYVKVTFKDKGKKEKNLFVKKFPKSEGYAAWVENMKIMKKEAYFFTTFLPKLREFCKQYTDKDLINFFPKCWYADDEMVVLENLVVDDTWVMLSKVEKQDLYTAKFALKNLATFHAAAHTFVEEECGGSEKFKEKHDLLCFEAFLNDSNPETAVMFGSGVGNCVKILEKFPVSGDTEAIEILKSFKGEAFDMMASVVKPTSGEKLHLLNHGDCWNNNMLFKHDPETGKVNDHIFVDLQMTRFCSPAVDVGYFNYLSVKSEIRREYLDDLLHHYFDNFKHTLQMFERDCPITYNEFFEDYKVKARMGFFMRLTLLSAIGAMKDMNMEEMPEDPKEVAEFFDKAIGNWVEKNQGIARAIATEIVAVIREDFKLQSN